MTARLESGKQAGRILVLVAACGLAAAQAQEVGQAMQSTESKNNAARQAQTEIDQVVAETDDLSEEYQTVTKEVDGLKIYNRLLEKQVEHQQRELSDLSSSMEQVTTTERQVTPLMVRMIDALGQFIEMDMPFLEEERRARVERLRGMMERADVSVAEKMRSVLEAYQIENEYGRSIEAYKGNLELDEGDREVDFLRIGRIGLYFRTEDGEHSGRWDHRAGEWQSLGAGVRRDIRDGLRIAREQIAPDLLMLPLPAAGEASQ